MEKLRLTIRSDEIISALKDLADIGQDILLWQNTGSVRIIENARISHIAHEEGTFALKPHSPEHKFQFKSELPIYFKGGNSNILFKRTINLASDKLIICDIPKEIRLSEKRKNSRLFFAPFEGSLIKIAKYYGKVAIPRRFELMLFDISTEGLAFFAGPMNIGQFKKNNLIELISIDNHVFNKPLDLNIIYSKHQVLRRGKTTKKVLRVGAKFITPLDPFLLSEIFA